MTYWCAWARVDGEFRASVRIDAAADGRIARVSAGVAAEPGDERLGVVVPGFANTHSHAFHRVLRGRTHDEGGDFWRWRDGMYAAAALLTPENYRVLATAVYSEMVGAGYAAVGEFHYVHHRALDAGAGAEPYPDHDMERALAAAAAEAGIRLTLLDTCYLDGDIGAPVSREQRRFSDRTADAWLERWHSLRGAIGGPRLTLGAAIHSVRAVDPASIARILVGLPADVPLHIHLSEQRRENADALAAWGVTPTRLLHDLGALDERLTVVHATHLDDEDVALLGAAGVTVAMCPTTEADLGDGIGPASRLAAAGASITIGSDQNAVVDPFLELRGLESGERLASGGRGIFSPGRLWNAAAADAGRSLEGGAADSSFGTIATGAWCDLVELDAASVRTAGSRLEQLVLTATAADVTGIVLAGRRVRGASEHAAGLYPAALAPFDPPTTVTEPTA